ncbi:MAG: hypothetical protein ACI82G_002497 [Bradymonadia bacterium]|jgi:hypothetical protein
MSRAVPQAFRRTAQNLHGPQRGIGIEHGVAVSDDVLSYVGDTVQNEALARDGQHDVSASKRPITDRAHSHDITIMNRRPHRPAFGRHFDRAAFEQGREVNARHPVSERSAPRVSAAITFASVSRHFDAAEPVVLPVSRCACAGQRLQ